MTRLYPTLLLCLFAAIGLQAQTVQVPPNVDSEDGFDFTYIDRYVDADTTATGEQAHDTYLLEAGGIYYFSKRNTWDFDISFGAYGDIETNGRPFVDRRNATGGSSRSDVYRGTGDISFSDLYIVMGDEGASASSYELSFLRGQGDGQRYSFDNCVLEKARQAIIRSEGENEKVFITNCHIYNLGDFELFQGNGRLVSPREGAVDSIVIKDNVIHNLLDRVYIGFRQSSMNYFEFSGNTVFNHVGRHGLIQLNNAAESVITNNLIENPSIMGTAPFLADEQIRQKGVANYLFTLDTIVEGASHTMSNNNIYWTQPVLEHYASFDSVSKPPVLSPLYVQALGDTSDAYFTEVLELENVPDVQPLIDYSREAILYKDSVGITNIMVEDAVFAGTEYDRGYLFDFSMFSPCYDPNSQSATAGTNGGAIGAVGLCGDLVASVGSEQLSPFIQLQALPNPAQEQITFTYKLENAGPVRLDVFSTGGQYVGNVVDAKQAIGEQRISWNGLTKLPAGMYFASIRTPQGRMYVKFFKQ